MAEEVEDEDDEDDEDYGPHHFWYYKLGKPALKPEEILPPPLMRNKEGEKIVPFRTAHGESPKSEWGHLSGTHYVMSRKINIPKNAGAKRTEKLIELKEAWEEELRREIKTYKKYVKKYKAMPTGRDYPENPTYVESINPLSGSLALTHNHICYTKGQLEIIEQELPNQQLTLNI